MLVVVEVVDARSALWRSAKKDEKKKKREKEEKKKKKKKKKRKKKKKKKKNKKIKTEAGGLSNTENLLSHQEYQQKLNRPSQKRDNEAWRC